ncbi:hypothetical protein AB0O72_13295 [Streptomyces sp. NPDC088106]|uniref:hypothetical protein n=1 Tax=unclassified Streptomyces TaxID=2593676 RepID=UPI003421C49C
MTPKRPPAPRTAEPPARTAGALARIRGRHRKPRLRKALLAASGLALAAGAVTLVRLASAPDGGTGVEVEAAPRPTAPPAQAVPPSGTPPATAPAPKGAPSSPEILGGQKATPLTPPGPPSRPRAPIPATAPETADTPTPTPPPSHAPAAPPPVHEEREPPPHRPDRPDSPAPTPPPEADPGLCIPLIGLCLGGGEPHRPEN